MFIYHIKFNYKIYRLSMTSNNFPKKCHAAIMIIDKSKFALSDNDNYCR